MTAFRFAKKKRRKPRTDNLKLISDSHLKLITDFYNFTSSLINIKTLETCDNCISKTANKTAQYALEFQVSDTPFSLHRISENTIHLTLLPNGLINKLKYTSIGYKMCKDFFNVNTGNFREHPSYKNVYIFDKEVNKQNTETWEEAINSLTLEMGKDNIKVKEITSKRNRMKKLIFTDLEKRDLDENLNAPFVYEFIYEKITYMCYLCLVFNFNNKQKVLVTLGFINNKNKHVSVMKQFLFIWEIQAVRQYIKEFYEKEHINSNYKIHYIDVCCIEPNTD